MSVYAVILREGPIQDQAAYDEYLRVGKLGKNTTPMKPVIAYGKIEAVEGTPADGVVVLEFETMELAKEWYHSDRYQAAVPHRIRSGDWRVMFVQGV